ncbi:MAG: hypothetical protein R2758_02740 [Bacteroidales bacterium]
MDIMTGQGRKFKENLSGQTRFSPAGKYLSWYQEADSSWYAYDIAAFEGDKAYKSVYPQGVG